MIARSTALFVLLTVSPSFADDPLRPMMVKLGDPVLMETFDTDRDEYDNWASTNKRWSSKNGVLIGLPSTSEYRERQGRSHNGAAPNLFIDFGGLDKPVPNVCVSIRFKYFKADADSEPVGKVGFAGKSTLLWIGPTSSRIGTLRYTYSSNEKLRFEQDRWYDCLFEVYEDEVTLQVAGGPTFYGNDENISLKDKEDKAHRVFISGPKEATVIIDHVKVWAATGLQVEWADSRKPFVAAYTPESIITKSKRKPKPVGN